ncbi:hypothetical protein D9M72_182050 [compost metagenome]
MTLCHPVKVKHMGADLDTKTALWTILPAKTKRAPRGKVNGLPHLVPLAILKASPTTRCGRFAPPSLSTDERYMSENTVREVLPRRGYANDDRTVPGFRAMAYDRAEIMARHRQLMTAWAPYLDRLRGDTGDRVPEGMPPVTPLSPRLG